MPDLREGLEVDGAPVVSHEEGSVNTQSGFEAALAAKVAPETPEEGTGSEPAPEGEPAAAQTPPAEGAEGEPATEPETPNEWQIRYEEAQKLIGRQGQELGELRRMIEEDRESRTAPYEAPVEVAPGDLESRVEQYGGDRTMQWAITSAPHLIDDVLDAWYDSDPAEARKFDRAYTRELARAEAAPPVADTPRLDPALEQVAFREKLNTIWGEAKATNADFASFERGLAPALEDPNTPDEIKLMLTSGNLDHMRAGVKFLVPYAKIHAAQIAPDDAATQAAVAAEAAKRTEDAADAKRKTAIVSGSQRLSAAGEQPNTDELTSEQRIALFKERFKEQDTTDISAGLTVNGVPVVPRG